MAMRCVLEPYANLSGWPVAARAELHHPTERSKRLKWVAKSPGGRQRVSWSVGG